MIIVTHKQTCNLEYMYLQGSSHAGPVRRGRLENRNDYPKNTTPHIDPRGDHTITIS